MKYVVIALGFLAFTFYELSGGADFDPSEIREARLAEIEAREAAKEAARLSAERKARIAALAKAPSVTVDETPQDETQPEVTLAAVTKPNVLSDAITTEIVPAALDSDRPVFENVALVSASADTPAIIPSLIDPNDPGNADTETFNLQVIEDIRTVSGNRVNVRSGPGTDYGVVNRMTRGETVKVLEDLGNGWVRLQPTDGGPIGWMADFLLVES